MSLNQHQSKRDKYFLLAALVGFVLWIVSVSPLRIVAASICQYGSWIFGVAPSFLAGCTFAFWQAYIVKSKPLESVAYAAALVTAAEIVQLYLPHYTFDVWDLVAGVVGSAIAMPVLLWRERRRRQELLDLDRSETLALKQKV